MAPEDTDQLLEGGKYKHLSEETLVSYRDSQLDKIRTAMADAHLRLCLICQGRLAFAREKAELQAMSEASRAAIQRSISKLKSENNAPGLISTEIQRLTAYINDLLDAWMVVFAKEATLGTEDGDEIWRYESEDGLLTAWAILKTEDASLVVHFSSPELSWEGARIRFKIGPFNEEVALRKEGSEVVAEIKIPRRERPRNLADISIEIL
jgi:hypothetical protein